MKISNNNDSLLNIKEQGSFFVGGRVIKEKGKYNTSEPFNSEGQTLHGDHAYVSYQIPENAHKYPLIFLHGAGESSKTWETTPDGRDGFSNIFLKKGYSVFLVDQPRRGKAGKTTIATDIQVKPNEQFWFEIFRLGLWPYFYQNSQFPRGGEALEQFFRQMTPDTGPFDLNIISNAMSALFQKIGDGILFTHSQGSSPGWHTRMRNSNVKSIIAFEPGNGFPFLPEDAPQPMPSSSPYGTLYPEIISFEEFETLTSIPLLIIYGDNIPDEPTNVWSQDNWRVRLDMARLWVEAINKHGGNAKLLHLPDINLIGNGHFAFTEMNNLQIANLVLNFIEENV